MKERNGIKVKNLDERAEYHSGGKMHKKDCLPIWSLVMALFCAATLAQTGDLPAIEIPECKSPPMLDGTLDDPVWQSATEIAHLYKIKSDAPAPETSLRLMRDNAWLYIGAQCANPNMAHVAQLTFNHDGAVNHDDALEILIRPSADQAADYYHFLLNFANVGKEQSCNQAGLREIGWNPVWRTATLRGKDGWTAEIAIPWFCLGQDDLSGLKINLGRTMVQVDLDDYGAKQNERRVLSTLTSGSKGGFHHPGNFLPVSGLAGFHPEVPFAPLVTAAEIAGVRQDGGSNYYDLRVTLATATPVPGVAQLKVVEDFGAGEAASHAQPLELRGTLELDLRIPAGNLQEHLVKIVVCDPDSGNLLASKQVEDTSALKIIKKAFAARSYYTSEESAGICVELGLPSNMLARAALVLEAGGNRVAEINGLKPVMAPAVPLSVLDFGDNKVMVRVVLDGAELAARPLNLVRLEPRPGYETKADFVRGVLLKDQEPFFPVGICAHNLQFRLGARGSLEDDGEMFKFLAEDVGLNLVVRSGGATNAAAFMDLAEKYGLMVVTWNYSTFCNKLGYPVNLIDPQHSPDLPLAKRLAIQKKSYDQGASYRDADLKVLRDYKNFVGYWNFDEPNLINPDERIAIAEWYWQTVKALDAYRPLFLLYSKHIPHGDNWTRWGDILGYDVYPRPHVSGFYSEPGLSTAFYAWELRERCRQDNKIMWFVPLANILDPGRSPIGLSKIHMLCQAYTAVIYGSRGLIYFALSCVAGEDAWDALRAISAQFKEMSPALVNGDIPQTIAYTPDNFDPRARKFPMVNAAVFQYPDGDYLLMAVNIMPHAVDTKFKVAGMERAARMFEEEGQSGKGAEGQRGLVLDGEVFADKIEPYGVRAYRMKIKPRPTDAATAGILSSSVDAGGLSCVAQRAEQDDRGSAPVEVSLDMTPVEEERAPEVDIPGIARQLMMGKNHMPNPCFEQQANKGIPDFYRPFWCLSVDPFWGQPDKSDWYVDDKVLWNGRKSLRMLKRKYDLGGFKTRGIFAGFYPPVSDKPMPIAFSFYARSESPKANLWIRIGEDTPFTVKGLTPDWQRHHITFDLPPGSGMNLGSRSMLIIPSDGDVIWISGLQVEQGDRPTEFQDDSVLLKKKVVPADPDNLLANPGAECGTAEGWAGLENLRVGEFGVRPGEAHTGEYAFHWRGQSQGVASDWIAVDTNRAYELSGWFKAGPASIKGVIFGVMLADAQKRPIRPWNVFSLQGTRTELAAPCRAGDRIVRLKDAANWKTSPSYAIAFGADENEYTPDVSPLGIDEVRREDDDWAVVLSKPCGLNLPAGTPVTENRAGNGGIFLPGAVNVTVPGDWTELKGSIGLKQWWPGTAYAQVVVIGLRPRQKQNALLMDDFAMRVSPDK
jgi:hypothetical protein